MARKHSRRMINQSVSASISGTWTASKTLMAVAIGLYVLTRFYLLFYARPLVSDVGMYRNYAIKAVDLKQTPYTEEFVVPYPPLAFWTACAPRYLDDRRITNPQDAQQVIPIIFDYDRGFRGLMFMCDLASFVMFLLILRKRRAEMAGWAAMLYVITTTILGNLLFDRLDVALLMFMMLGAYCWTRTSEQSRRSIAWAMLSYAIIGLGISFKIIPVLCVPFFLLADYHAPRRFIRLGLALAVLAATISAVFNTMGGDRSQCVRDIQVSCRAGSAPGIAVFFVDVDCFDLRGED